MATRVQFDANGLRVSKPGFDANGGPAGLLLDTNIRYGQLLDHLLINLNRNVYTGANAAYKAALSEGIESCDGNFWYGPYAEPPDVVCMGLVNGRYENPPVEYGTPTTSTGKWVMQVTSGPSNTYVSFTRPTGSIGYGLTMPHQAMLAVFRKPRFG